MNNIVEFYIFFGTNCGAYYGSNIQTYLFEIIWKPSFGDRILRLTSNCPISENGVIVLDWKMSMGVPGMIR